MKTEVSPQQVEQFRRQGFILMEGFLDADELQHWREVTEAAIRLRINAKTILSNQANQNSFYAQVFTQCLRLADIHPAMAEIMLQRHRKRLARRLFQYAA